MSVCYVMSGHYKSPYAGAPLLGVSLYASSDGGQIWTAHPMPYGFVATSQIACGDAYNCAAGGTHDGQSVFAATNDGGESWALDPLPSVVGHLDTLSCPSKDFCAGLAAKSNLLSEGTTDATFLFTTDGGKTFTDEPLVRGDSMQSLSCSSDQDCTAIGSSDHLGGPDNFAAGVSARTTDGGATWSPGTIPDGLGVERNSALSCGDARHCWMIGLMAIPFQNPPRCAGIPIHEPPGTTTPTTSVQSPAVAAVAQAESAATAKEFQKEAGLPQVGCSAPGWPLIIGALASTNNGGLSWTPDSLPSDVPQPVFEGLSCPTDSQCWVTGSDAVPRQVGTTYDGGQPACSEPPMEERRGPTSLSKCLGGRRTPTARATSAWVGSPVLQRARASHLETQHRVRRVRPSTALLQRIELTGTDQMFCPTQRLRRLSGSVVWGR